MNLKPTRLLSELLVFIESLFIESYRPLLFRHPHARPFVLLHCARGEAVPTGWLLQHFEYIALQVVAAAPPPPPRHLRRPLACFSSSASTSESGMALSETRSSSSSSSSVANTPVKNALRQTKHAVVHFFPVRSVFNPLHPGFRSNGSWAWHQRVWVIFSFHLSGSYTAQDSVPDAMLQDTRICFPDHFLPSP